MNLKPVGRNMYVTATIKQKTCEKLIQVSSMMSLYFLQPDMMIYIRKIKSARKGKKRMYSRQWSDNSCNEKFAFT